MNASGGSRAKNEQKRFTFAINKYWCVGQKWNAKITFESKIRFFYLSQRNRLDASSGSLRLTRSTGASATKENLVSWLMKFNAADRSNYYGRRSPLVGVTKCAHIYHRRWSPYDVPSTSGQHQFSIGVYQSPHSMSLMCEWNGIDMFCPLLAPVRACISLLLEPCLVPFGVCCRCCCRCMCVCANCQWKNRCSQLLLFYK